MAKAVRRSREQTEGRLVAAVGVVLARDGVRGVGVNALAREAGVDKVLIYRYFGGLHELVSAYALSGDFWPTVEELTASCCSDCEVGTSAQMLSRFFRGFAQAILKRPQTLEILAWEMVERNELTDILDNRRERTALELLQRLPQGISSALDLTAVISLLAGAVSYLAIASRRRGSMGGLDLRSVAGWERVFDTLDIMIMKVCG